MYRVRFIWIWEYEWKIGACRRHCGRSFRRFTATPKKGKFIFGFLVRKSSPKSSTKLSSLREYVITSSWPRSRSQVRTGRQAPQPALLWQASWPDFDSRVHTVI